MSRILCAWSPTWAIANWRRRNPSDSPVEPFVLIETVRAVRRLSAVSEAARRLGLHVGQKATDAMALAPELVTAEAEPEADAAALAALADWCVRFSPAVAIDAPDGLFLDVTGVDHLWGGEPALLADFRKRLAANGLPFRCTIADTPGAAWALAHYGEAHFGKESAIAPPGGQGELLSPLRPAALRFDQATWAQVERLGIRQVGQLLSIPRGPFARRFGRAAMTRVDQALGRETEALTFRRPPSAWFARLAFAEPISAPEDMARVAHDVAAQLCARLDAKGLGARRFEILFHRVDGQAAPVEVGLALPGRDAARIGKLFAPKLEAIDPGFGIEVVTITAEGVEPISGRQARLDAGRETTVEEGLAPLVDRLMNRLGEDRVWRAQPVESHVPELAVGRAKPLSSPLAKSSARDSQEARPWNPATPRPARLFRRPEPVDMVLAITPDDPPSQFRWRGQTHRVRRAEGPERIGEEWWKGAIEDADVGHVRDYYRVEDANGGRFWLFRAGLYGDPDVPPKWWLHGVFG